MWHETAGFFPLFILYFRPSSSLRSTPQRIHKNSGCLNFMFKVTGHIWGLKTPWKTFFNTLSSLLPLPRLEPREPHFSSVRGCMSPKALQKKQCFLKSSKGKHSQAIKSSFSFLLFIYLFIYFKNVFTYAIFFASLLGFWNTTCRKQTRVKTINSSELTPMQPQWVPVHV